MYATAVERLCVQVLEMRVLYNIGSGFGTLETSVHLRCAVQVYDILKPVLLEKEKAEQRLRVRPLHASLALPGPGPVLRCCMLFVCRQSAW